MKLRAFFVFISVTLLHFRVGMATTTHPSNISMMTLSQVNRILWNSNLSWTLLIFLQDMFATMAIVN